VVITYESDTFSFCDLLENVDVLYNYNSMDKKSEALIAELVYFSSGEEW
jgi:hypothetical protein